MAGLKTGALNMGTKNNPGKFDCYQAAEPDEPMFVLLARDKHAPTLIWLWSVMRKLDGEDPAKVQEAGDCVMAMFEWQKAHGRPATGIGQAALAAVVELIGAANWGHDHMRELTGKEQINQPTQLEVIRQYLCATNWDLKESSPE
jgi:hypothetical protein